MKGAQGGYDAGGADSPGSMSSSASKVVAERGYVVVSAGNAVSVTGASSADDMEETDEVARKEDESSEEELELGLSLGTKTAVAGAGASEAQRKQRCRILTANNFPSLLSSRASPRSSSSSSVSSSSGANPGGGVAGTKRAAADSVSPDAAEGNPHPPCNQVVVGWPPIRAFRMNSLFNQSKDHSSNSEVMAANKANHHASGEKNNVEAFIGSKDTKMNGKAIPRSSLFVKINMDGDPIGRKVDVVAHHSYETLAITLEDMFKKQTIAFNSSVQGLKASKLLDSSSEFCLTYEDKDGDWMLVGDVPWGMFLDSVKRLRIMRTSDINGLGQRLQSSCTARSTGSKHS